MEYILPPERTFNKDSRQNVREVAVLKRLVLICL